MPFKAVTFAFLFAGLLATPGASKAQVSQPQTYAAVRQALIDGKRVTVTMDFGKCPGDRIPIGSGLAIQSFMINDASTNAHIAFSDLHPTVQRVGNSVDGRIANEFIRYTVEPRSPKDTVTLDVYTWPPGATTAVLKHTTICQLGNGAMFNW
jgi:VirK protein